MKSTEGFKEVIQLHLTEIAKNDPLFNKSFQKESKNIDDCIKYILNTVKNSGCNGFSDDEVFNMAMHYYDEDDIKVGSEVSARIVINKPSEKQEKQPIEKKVKAVAVPIQKVDFLQGQISLF